MQHALPPFAPSTGLRLCVAAITALCLQGQAWSNPRAGTAPTVIGNCVSAERMSFRPGVDGTLLDTTDAADVAAAIVSRYPVMARDGLYPEAVALWRPRGGDWVYATLMRKAHAPHAPCFTANVSAAGMGLTPGLLKKYFGPAP